MAVWYTHCNVMMMMPQKLLQQCPEMITGQAKQDRLAVEKLGQNLGTISLEIAGIQKREKDLTQSLHRIQDFQKTFHERVSEAGRKLVHIKSLLASKQS